MPSVCLSNSSEQESMRINVTPHSHCGFEDVCLCVLLKHLPVTLVDQIITFMCHRLFSHRFQIAINKVQFLFQTINRAETMLSIGAQIRMESVHPRGKDKISQSKKIKINPSFSQNTSENFPVHHQKLVLSNLYDLIYK